jgi:hypothetical protein
MSCRSDYQIRLRINPQADQKPNLLKQGTMAFPTCFSRFDGLTAWEFIPRRIEADDYSGYGVIR